MAPSEPNNHLWHVLSKDVMFLNQQRWEDYQSTVDAQTGTLREFLRITPSPKALALMDLIRRNRPQALRKFDQISMRDDDLATQAILMARRLAGKSVVFMGDNDCASLALGILGTQLGYPLPSKMVIVDFDERLLRAQSKFARWYGFRHLIDFRLYNAFEPVPRDLQNHFDWFYTNPPYGASNYGMSVQLFINRGCEMTKPAGYGCIIIPHDEERKWTQSAMLSTQRFLANRGWVITDKVNDLHRYHLDDDNELTSSTLIVHDAASITLDESIRVYDNRRIEHHEIPLFYGKSVQPPYPRFIRADGTEEYCNDREAA